MKPAPVSSADIGGAAMILAVPGMSSIQQV
jgi:hypothetical protein